MHAKYLKYLLAFEIELSRGATETVVYPTAKKSAKDKAAMMAEKLAKRALVSFATMRSFFGMVRPVAIWLQRHLGFGTVQSRQEIFASALSASAVPKGAVSESLLLPNSKNCDRSLSLSKAMTRLSSRSSHSIPYKNTLQAWE